MWREIDRQDGDLNWDRFYKDFKFRPSVHEKDWPGIREPLPSITYTISHIYGDEDRRVALEKNLLISAWEIFQQLTEPNERMIALDWQHPCYWFTPCELPKPNDYQEWPIPILPDGDYYIFLAEDFRFGVFGHPWEQTMCFFGEPLIAAVEKIRPELLTKVARKDGKAV